MVLVMWGHLINTGMCDYEIPGVIQGRMSSPIIEPAGYVLGIFESFLFNRLHTQAAVMGVVMFFICTGYLVTGMTQRYSTKEFLVNRFFRIFPVLWISLIIIGVTVFFSQGIVVSPLQFFASATLLFQPIKVASMAGVLWTLVIEVLFYLFVALYGRIDESFILFLYLVIVLCGIVYCEFPSTDAYNLLYDLKYMGFTLFGVAVKLAENSNDKGIQRFRIPAVSFVLNQVIFLVLQARIGDVTTYPHFFTHFIPVAIFLFLLGMEKSFPDCFNKVPKVVSSLAEIVYPGYLLHVCIGLTVMYWSAQAGVNRYLLPVLGAIVSLCVAKALQVSVEKWAIGQSKKIIARLRQSVE